MSSAKEKFLKGPEKDLWDRIQDYQSELIGRKYKQNRERVQKLRERIKEQSKACDEIILKTHLLEGVNDIMSVLPERKYVSVDDEISEVVGFGEEIHAFINEYTDVNKIKYKGRVIRANWSRNSDGDGPYINIKVLPNGTIVFDCAKLVMPVHQFQWQANHDIIPNKLSDAFHHPNYSSTPSPTM